MIGLVDCNNFYVSCERVFRPELQGKPVVVLSNNDGCVISRSEEAKKLGIEMAEPAHKRKDFFKENNVYCFSSNYCLYGDMSQRVMDILSDAVPEIEVYSIDEAFINLDGIFNLDIFLKELRKRILKSTGIPVSIGAGPTKTLAKVANKEAKQNDGILIIDSDGFREELLKRTPVGKVWGIGRQYQKFMAQYQIETAWQFTQQNENWVKKNMSVVGHRVQRELRGKPCISIEDSPKSKKVIATTRGFGKKIDNKELIKEAVSTHAIRCAEKLRRQHSLANLVTVFIHTDPFNPNEKVYYRSQTVILPLPSNNNAFLVKAALKGLDVVFLNGLFYKKAGVIVSGITSESHLQGNLFFEEDRARQNKISEATDIINRRYGRDTLKLAAQGTHNEWKHKQEKLSKKYTTNLNDIIEVKS